MFARRAMPRWAAVALLVLLLAGCGGRLTSVYDKPTDIALFELAGEVNAQMQWLGVGDARPTYREAMGAGVYERVRGELDRIRLRAESRAKTGLLIEALDGLLASWNEVATAHERSGRLNPIFADLARRGLREQIGAAMKQEIEKKERGLK